MPKQYKLHPDLSILTANEFFTDEEKALQLDDKLGGSQLKAISKGKAFVLAGKKYHFIINPTIKTFLSIFTQEGGSNKKESLRQMAQLAGCDEETIKSTIADFFKKMKKEGIIVPIDYQPIEQSAANTFYIGQQVLEFIILETINTHKDTEVYLVKNVRTDEKFILKALRPPYDKDEEERKAFTQEFKMMLSIRRHPNICQSYGYVSNSDFTVGIMEYIDGESPRKLIKRRNPSVSINQRIHIIQQMCDAVAQLHKKGITHGDIHSSNFLVTDNFSVKLIDFGMTHHATPKPNQIAIRGGVTHYLPPEFIHKSSFDHVHTRPDFRSEVYQLGVIAYIVLYEKLPFRGLTWHNLLVAIKEQSLLFPTTISTGEIIPTHIIEVLQKMMSKNPEKRYANALELTNVLLPQLALTA